MSKGVVFVVFCVCSISRSTHGTPHKLRAQSSQHRTSGAGCFTNASTCNGAENRAGHNVRDRRGCLSWVSRRAVHAVCACHFDGNMPCCASSSLLHGRRVDTCLFEKCGQEAFLKRLVASSITFVAMNNEGRMSTQLPTASLFRCVSCNGSYPSECTRPVLHRAACSVEDAHVQHSLCRPVPSHFMLRSRTTTALGLAPTKRLPGIAGLSISLSINGHQCARACQTLCIGTDGFKSGDRLGTLDIPVCKAATKAEPYVNRACCKRCSNTCYSRSCLQLMSLSPLDVFKTLSGHLLPMLHRMLAPVSFMFLHA